MYGMIKLGLIAFIGIICIPYIAQKPGWTEPDQSYAYKEKYVESRFPREVLVHPDYFALHDVNAMKKRLWKKREQSEKRTKNKE
jgi:hypothetical protein